MINAMTVARAGYTTGGGMTAGYYLSAAVPDDARPLIGLIIVVVMALFGLAAVALFILLMRR